MAGAVARCLAGGGRLAVEAGTGVGKTFAYLYPALRLARGLPGPLVISTQTLNLQAQIEGRDLPALLPLLEDKPSFHVARGGANYLCRKKVQDLALSPGLPGMEALPSLEELMAWSDTGEGLLDRFPGGLSARSRGMISYDPHSCWRGCPEWGSCRFIADRERLRAARVIVVNHALLLADARLRASGSRLLPDYSALIVDEAHRLPDTAEDQLSVRLGAEEGRRLLRALASASQDPETGSLLQGSTRLAAQVGAAFEELSQVVGERLRRGRLTEAETATLPGGRPPVESVSAGLSKLGEALERIADEAPSEESAARFMQIASAASGLARDASLFAGKEEDGWVHWAQLRDSGEGDLVATPLKPGAVLAAHLFKRVRSVVLTSATLAAGGSLGYFLRRVGLPEAEPLILGTPFNYKKQMSLILHPAFPEPGHPEFALRAARLLVREAGRARGGLLALFTARRMLAEVGDLVDELAEGPVFRQDGELSRDRLLAKFRKEGGMLLGLRSFWEGVDLPGREAEVLVVMRLPFPVPDGPVERARSRSLETEGLNPFQDYSLPEAALTLRQGVGRLIRSKTDSGKVLILDPRIATRSYGKFFLRSLPECPVTSGDEEDD